MYQNLLDTFYRHRPIVLLFTVILWLLAVFSASGLKLNENIMDLLPDKDSRISAFREIYDKFNPMNTVFIDIALTGGKHNPELLISSADSVYTSLKNTSFFNDIIYRWQFQDLQKALKVLSDHRTVLFTKEDSIAIQKKLSYAYISKRMLEWKRAMLETPSPFLAEQFINDPFNFNAIFQKKLIGSQAANENITIHQGRLFNKSLDHILIIAQPKFKSTDTGSSREMIEFLDSLFKNLKDKSGDLIDISYLSAHRFSVENANRIQSDIQRTVSIALIAIIILSLLVYSRPVLMILTLLPALFGSALSLGIIRIFDPAISAIIIGSGAMLIGITVDYGIHFLYHVDQTFSPGGSESSISIATRLIKPLVLSAGTTIIAFLALQFSDLPGYRQLSWFVMFGIFGALIFVILILPLLVKISAQDKKPLLKLYKIFPLLFDFIRKRRAFILIFIGLLTIAAIPGFLKIEFDGDVQNLNAVSPTIQKDIMKIKNVYGNILSSTLMMVKSDEMDHALQKNEIILKKIKQKFSNDTIQISNPLIEFLPSMSQQEKNKIRWQELFDEQGKNRIRQLLDKVANEYGLKAGAFNLFIENLTTASMDIKIDSYRGTPIETIMKNIIQSDSTQTYLLSNVNASSESQVEKLSEFTSSEDKNIIIYDGKQFVGRIVHLILSELERVGLLAFIFVLLFIIVSVRSIKTIIVLFLPLFISTFWTFSILGWFGIKINIINSIVSVFIFGLVIDYCIFLVSGFKDTSNGITIKHIHISSGAILISALTTIIGLGALIFARHPALFSLGLTAVIGIGSGLIVVAFLIPSIMLKTKDLSK